ELVISLVVVLGGAAQAQVLSRVDQDLRVIYTEYTLAVVDLGHVNTELSRYRTTILRAMEATTKPEFMRIAESLPFQRGRIESTIERFSQIVKSAAIDKFHRTEELAELDEVQDNLAAYLTASEYTIGLLRQLWATPAGGSAGQIRERAEDNAAKDAGGKFIAVTLALDRLIETVSAIAAQIRTDADKRLRMLTAATMGFTVLVVLVVISPIGRSRTAHP
ncbi:MAG: MCP four helix bundle domain-containing protein, partial [Nitrospiraceae bacterium]